MKRIIILVYLFCFSLAYIVIPFHYINDIEKKSFILNEDIKGKEFLELTTNKLFSTISVGSPYKSLELYLTMDYTLFFIGKGYCGKDSISYYEPFESTTFKNDQFFPYPFDDLRNMTIGNDTCTLFDDYNLKSNITLKFIHLLYGSKINLLNDVIYKDKVCGIMGFKLHEMQDSYYYKFKPYSFENSLKANDVINYTYWTIEFFDENEKSKNQGYDGYLILAAYDDKYFKDVKNINKEEINFYYTTSLSSAVEWALNFQEIYYIDPKTQNKTKMKNNSFLKAEFFFDLNYYFASKEYFETIKNDFFAEYIESGKCKVTKLKEFYLRYQFISCDKSFNDETQKFPTLYFKHVGYNYIFELTYKDCFKKIDDQILFLIFYDPWSPDTFKVGKNFMKKYNFIFRGDAKQIGFINYEKKDDGNKDNDDKQGGNEEDSQNPENPGNSEENKKANFRKQLLWIILLVVLLIGIIIGVLVGKKIWDNQRKKRANELLDDDYEYSANNNNEETDQKIN